MVNKLGRQDWIDEALRTLMHGGIDAVRVEPLAKALGVTKGSFYWHFRDRTALLQAMLETWRERATNAIIEKVDAAGGDALLRLSNLFGLTVNSDGRLERAIRSWAGTDEIARLALIDVDARRIDYVQALFRQLGFPAAEALSRSRMAYLALIGQFMLDRDQNNWLAESLDDVIPMMTQPLRQS